MRDFTVLVLLNLTFDGDWHIDGHLLGLASRTFSAVTVSCSFDDLMSSAQAKSSNERATDRRMHRCEDFSYDPKLLKS